MSLWTRRLLLLALLIGVILFIASPKPPPPAYLKLDVKSGTTTTEHLPDPIWVRSATAGQSWSGTVGMVHVDDAKRFAIHYTVGCWHCDETDPPEDAMQTPQAPGAQITELDSRGTVLRTTPWQMFANFAPQYEISDLLIRQDGGFVLAGHGTVREPSPPPMSDPPIHPIRMQHVLFVQELDPAGNLKWQRHFATEAGQRGPQLGGGLTGDVQLLGAYGYGTYERQFSEGQLITVEAADDQAVRYTTIDAAGEVRDSIELARISDMQYGTAWHLASDGSALAANITPTPDLDESASSFDITLLRMSDSASGIASTRIGTFESYGDLLLAGNASSGGTLVVESAANWGVFDSSRGQVETHRPGSGRLIAFCHFDAAGVLQWVRELPIPSSENVVRNLAVSAAGDSFAMIASNAGVEFRDSRQVVRLAAATREPDIGCLTTIALLHLNPKGQIRSCRAIANVADFLEGPGCGLSNEIGLGNPAVAIGETGILVMAPTDEPTLGMPAGDSKGVWYNPGLMIAELPFD